MPGMKGLPGDTRVKEEDEEKNATKNEQGKIELLSWKADMSKKGSVALEEPQISGWLFSANVIVTMWISQVCYYAANRLAKVVWKHLQTDASELYTFIQAISK